MCMNAQFYGTFARIGADRETFRKSELPPDTPGCKLRVSMPLRCGFADGRRPGGGAGRGWGGPREAAMTNADNLDTELALDEEGSLPLSLPEVPPRKRGGGPKTPEGRDRARRNSLKHGM